MKGQKTQKSQHDAEEKYEQSQRTHIMSSKLVTTLHYNVTVWYWQKKGHTDQWNRKEPRNRSIQIQ